MRIWRENKELTLAHIEFGLLLENPMRCPVGNLDLCPKDGKVMEILGHEFMVLEAMVMEKMLRGIRK